MVNKTKTTYRFESIPNGMFLKFLYTLAIVLLSFTTILYSYKTCNCELCHTKQRAKSHVTYIKNNSFAIPPFLKHAASNYSLNGLFVPGASILVISSNKLLKVELFPSFWLFIRVFTVYRAVY